MDNQEVTTTESAVPQKKLSIWYKIFGATPGDGEMQPKEALSYSWCGFGQNLICTIIGSYLTVFMTDAIGFPALAVAFLMLGARLFDAANDPIMGSIVDRTRTPWGKCRPYLKWMALPIAIMTMLCFLPWYPNSDGGFAAISIMYIIWSIVYTVADVPYWGLSTAMSNDTFRRGNMLTVARLFCTVGAGLVTIIVPLVTSNITGDGQAQISAIQTLVNDLAAGNLDVFMGMTNIGANPLLTSTKELTAAVKTLMDAGVNLNVDGGVLITLQGALKADVQESLRWIYFISAIVCVVAAVPLFFLGFKNAKERNQAVDNPPTLVHNLKLLFKNKPLMLVVLSGIGGAGRMLFTYTGGLYFAKYVLADVSILGGFMKGEALYTLFTMAVVPGGLIASLLVPYCTKKFGKKNTYIWSHIVGGVAMIIAFVVGITTDQGSYTGIATLVVLFLALVIAGVPTGFGNIITYAMIGDTVEYLEMKTGERAEGICFAMQTFINKVGMAIGAFIGVLAYFIADVEANNAAALTPADKDTLWIMLVLIAAISFFLTVIPLFFYKFNEKEQQEAVAEIRARKAAEGAGVGEFNMESGTEISDNFIENLSSSISFSNEDIENMEIAEKSDITDDEFNKDGEND